MIKGTLLVAAIAALSVLTISPRHLARHAPTHETLLAQSANDVDHITHNAAHDHALFGLVSMIDKAFSVLEPEAHATTSNNVVSLLQYADGPEGGPKAGSAFGSGSSNGQWWALRGQPNRTFHRIEVRDSSGCVIALGHGTSPNQVVDLYVGGGGGPGGGGNSTADREYTWGLSYGGSASCLWWKKVDCEPIQGQQVINFIY